MQVEKDETQKPALGAVEQLSEEQRAEEWALFEKIIYQNLDRVLEKRPANPVSKFAK